MQATEKQVDKTGIPTSNIYHMDFMKWRSVSELNNQQDIIMQTYLSKSKYHKMNYSLENQSTVKGP